jgi:hypothetical protein
MNHFNAVTLCGHMQVLHGGAARYECMISSEGGGAIVAGRTERVRDALEKVSEFCGKVGFEASKEIIAVSAGDLRDQEKDLSSLVAAIKNACMVLERDVFYGRFLYVSSDRTQYLDKPQLFGPSVHSAFPTARQDIIDAGNCLAAECSTGAVFHLMRVAEYGLRALARDRRVSLPRNAVLELATWEAVMKELEDAEVAIQGYQKTPAREAQFEFYHGASMEFKRFKNKFRNRVMHTRDEYDRHEALSALNHVQAFMQILSSRISETKRTPVIWKGPMWTKSGV